MIICLKIGKAVQIVLAYHLKDSFLYGNHVIVIYWFQLKVHTKERWRNWCSCCTDWSKGVGGKGKVKRDRWSCYTEWSKAIYFTWGRRSPFFFRCLSKCYSLLSQKIKFRLGSIAFEWSSFHSRYWLWNWWQLFKSMVLQK